VRDLKGLPNNKFRGSRMASFFRTYRITEDGTRIDGVFAMAFIHNGDYHLTHISIYEDGMIDCWGLVDFAKFKKKVRSGWVVTQPPKKAPDQRIVPRLVHGHRRLLLDRAGGIHQGGRR
jgi:hypothetical protein